MGSCNNYRLISAILEDEPLDGQLFWANPPRVDEVETMIDCGRLGKPVGTGVTQ
jgi:hypothetical protein